MVVLLSSTATVRILSLHPDIAMEGEGKSIPRAKHCDRSLLKSRRTSYVKGMRKGRWGCVEASKCDRYLVGEKHEECVVWV